MCVTLCPGPRVPFSSEKGCWRWWWKASVFILVILSTWNTNVVTFRSPDLWLFIPLCSVPRFSFMGMYKKVVDWRPFHDLLEDGIMNPVSEFYENEMEDWNDTSFNVNQEWQVAQSSASVSISIVFFPYVPPNRLRSHRGIGVRKDVSSGQVKKWTGNRRKYKGQFDSAFFRHDEWIPHLPGTYTTTWSTAFSRNNMNPFLRFDTVKHRLDYRKGRGNCPSILSVASEDHP